MTTDILLDLVWKSLVCAGAALLMLGLSRRRSAAEQSLLAQFGLLAALALPLTAFSVTPVEVEAPGLVAQLYAQALQAAPEAIAPAGPLDAVAAPAAFRPGPALILGLYSVPALALLLMALLSLARLRRLSAAASPLANSDWRCALDRGRARLGVRRRVALLVSDEVAAPISWGLTRLVILIDPRTAADARHADAVIAHELAHFARLDWPALLLGRLVTALFWFNPLLWLLARRAQDLSEQAADDVVLGGDMAATDYADLLVGTARAAAPLLLAANGLGSGSSLTRRVLSALDPSRRRARAHAGWWLAALLGGLGAGASLAAVDPQVPAEAAAAPTLVALAAQPPARTTAAPAPHARAGSCRSHHHHRARAAARATSDGARVAMARMSGKTVPA